MKDYNDKKKFDKTSRDKFSPKKAPEKKAQGKFSPDNTIQKKAPDAILEKPIIIEKVGDELEGVCYIHGVRHLVKGALPTEEVLVCNPVTSGSVVLCELKSVVKPSQQRREPPCPYYLQCGGCDLMYVDYQAQLALKKALIARKLKCPTKVMDAVGVTDFACRNKVHLVFKGSTENMEIGFFDSKTHAVVDIPSCLMHGELYVLLVDALKIWCKKYGIIAYNPKKGRGTLRFAVARFFDGCIMLTLVATAMVDGTEFLYNELLKRFNSVSLGLNINNERSNEVLAGKHTHLFGKPYLLGTQNGVVFELGSGDFLQTNTQIAEAIYDKITNFFVSRNVGLVVDAYSGIGITSSLFASKGIKVISVELSEDAVNNAKRCAELNGTSDMIDFYSGDFSKQLPLLSNVINAERNSLTKNGAVGLFVDPPRRGLGEDVCRSVLNVSPDYLVYLSCSLSGLTRDLSILSTAYDMVTVVPYDMFPNTHYIETLCIMERKK